MFRTSSDTRYLTSVAHRDWIYSSPFEIFAQEAHVQVCLNEVGLISSVAGFALHRDCLNVNKARWVPCNQCLCVWFDFKYHVVYGLQCHVLVNDLLELVKGVVFIHVGVHTVDEVASANDSPLLQFGLGVRQGIPSSARMHSHEHTDNSIQTVGVRMIMPMNASFGKVSRACAGSKSRNQL